MFSVGSFYKMQHPVRVSWLCSFLLHAHSLFPPRPSHRHVFVLISLFFPFKASLGHLDLSGRLTSKGGGPKSWLDWSLLTGRRGTWFGCTASSRNPQCQYLYIFSLFISFLCSAFPRLFYCPAWEVIAWHQSGDRVVPGGWGLKILPVDVPLITCSV